MKDKATIKGKKTECILGIIFLIPPIISLIAFMLCLISDEPSRFARLTNLKGVWDWQSHSSAGVSSSPTPIYLGLMAIAGAYLIKDSLRYLFIDTEDKKEVTNETKEDAQ